jgi:hypothetical protein
MSPLTIRSLLRNHWPVLGALVIFAVFMLVNQLWFVPTARRYEAALKTATAVGMPLDPNLAPRIIPPRIFALVADNTMPAVEAQDAANSGTLTAQFLGELTEVLSRRGLRVTTTEPAPLTQEGRIIHVRAHLRAKGRFADFVDVLDDLAHDKRLYGVDRFTVDPETTAEINVELWMSRLILKGVKS